MALVIPRDLFNHANLLKCYGKIYINLEKTNSRFKLEFVEIDETTDTNFHVNEDQNGNTSVSNVIMTDDEGNLIELSRPLNSRRPWPLRAFDYDTEENIDVFSDDGEFTKEFVELIK